MFKTNKKIIKYIIFIILLPYFLSGKGESYSNMNSYSNKNHKYINHQNISLKKRIYNFFYQRKNYALIKMFFLKKKKFIIMNHPSDISEAIFKKKDYKKALINFNNIINKYLFKKELYYNALYLKKYYLAINFLKIILKDNIDAEEKGMCYYLFFKKTRIKYIKIFKYLPKIDKMIAFITLKKESMYYKKVFKQIINDYQDIPKYYISQVEKENYSFEETIKLHNTYLQFYLENYEMNLSFPSKIKKQFQKIEINQKLTKYLIQ